MVFLIVYFCSSRLEESKTSLNTYIILFEKYSGTILDTKYEKKTLFAVPENKKSP